MFFESFSLGSRHSLSYSRHRNEKTRKKARYHRDRSVTIVDGFPSHIVYGSRARSITVRPDGSSIILRAAAPRGTVCRAPAHGTARRTTIGNGRGLSRRPSRSRQRRAPIRQILRSRAGCCTASGSGGALPQDDTVRRVLQAVTGMEFRKSNGALTRRCVRAPCSSIGSEGQSRIVSGSMPLRAHHSR